MADRIGGGRPSGASPRQDSSARRRSSSSSSRYSPRRSASLPSRSHSPDERRRPSSMSRSPSLSSRGSASPLPKRDTDHASGENRSDPWSKRSPSRNRYHRNQDEEREMSAVEIRGLTKMVYERHLDIIFGNYGRIIEIVLPLYKHSGENRGKAHIVFQSPAHAKRAAQHMHGGQVDGVIVDVNQVIAPTARELDEMKRMSLQETAYGDSHAHAYGYGDYRGNGRGGGGGGGGGRSVRGSGRGRRRERAREPSYDRNARGFGELQEGRLAGWKDRGDFLTRGDVGREPSRRSRSPPSPRRGRAVSNMSREPIHSPERE